MKKQPHDNQPSTFSAVAQASRLVRRKASPMALEQRFMFDGAALIEAQAVLDTADVGHAQGIDSSANTAPLLLVSEPGAPDALTQALESAQAQVSAFLQKPEAASVLEQLFPSPSQKSAGEWQAAVHSLVSTGSFGNGPVTVELLSHAGLQGAYGAFSAADGAHAATIYLNRDWLSTGPDTTAVTRVLVEELGHAIDSALNGPSDTQGDEGEAFAVAVLHLNISDSERERIATENDTRTLLLDGRSVTVETAAITFSAVYQGTPSALSEEAQSLNNIQVLAGSNFTFTSSNPSDLYFSGNNVTGTLSYTDGDGDPQTIYGVASRLFKTGSTVDGIYFYATGVDGMIGTGDTGESAYLMRGSDVFAVGSNNGTSSDPVDTTLNNLLVAYLPPTAYNDSSSSLGALPAIESGAATAGQNATGNVLSNDTGSSTPSVTHVGTTSASDPVTAASTGADVSGGTSVAGTYGKLYIAADGTYRYVVDNADPAVDALLDAADTLTDRFTYELTDAEGNTATATLTITIQGANDAPVAANDDTLGATEDTPVTFSAAELLGNDTDVDSTGLTIQSVTNGTGGTVVLNGDGTVTFTPNANFTGAATFSYVMNDGTGPTSGTSTANVTINVAAVNDAPLAEDNHYGTLKNKVLSGVNVLTDTDTTHGLDGDPEGDTLSISKVNGQLFTANSTHGTYTAALGWMEVALNHGTLYIQANGATVYQPANNDIAVDSFSYVATDGLDESAAALVSFTVTDPSNTPAVIGGDDVGAVTEDLAVSAGNLTDTGTLSVTDPDAGEASFLTDASDITASAGTLGSLSITSAGVWTYTVANADVQYLAASQTKTETFTVKTVDGSTHDVVVTITGVNDAPVPNPTAPDWDAADGRNEVTTPEDTPKSGTITAGDADSDTLSFAEKTGPANGSLTLDPLTGDWTYTPDPDYVGNDSFVVTVSDGKGGSVDVTVMVTVTPVADPAVISGDAVGAVTEDAATPTLSDTGSLSVTDPDAGEASFLTGASDITASSGALGSLSITSAGVWTYTVANADVQYLHPGETKTETFTIRSTDGSTHDVVIVIHGVDDDRAITVAGLPDVSEGSKAIFTVALPGGNARDTEITLALSTGSAEADDYSALAGASAHYFDGNGDKQPLSISPTGKLTLPDGVASFFVSVPTTNDSDLEGAEAFSLSASITAGKSASDTSTILDDGSGKVYDENGTDSGAPGNDDRTVTVAGLDDVSEGSNVVFSVALPEGNPHATEIGLSLSTGSAEVADYSELAGASAFYVDGDGQKQTLTITDGKITLLAGVSRFFVLVPTTDDTPFEGAETLRLSAAIINGKSASDTATILDDGSGKVYDDSGTDSGVAPDNDRLVPTPVAESAAVDASPAVVLAPEASTPREPLRFDSTTFVALPSDQQPQLSVEVLALVQRGSMETEVPRLLTQATGFQVLVNERQSGQLELNRTIDKQFVEAGAQGGISLPYDTFTHSDPNARITLTANLSDGRPLPKWVSFEARTGTFTVQAPAGYVGDLEVEVSARDDKGNEVKTKFKLTVGAKAAVTGREGLSDQLRQASKSAFVWRDLVRIEPAAAPARESAPTQRVPRVVA